MIKLENYEVLGWEHAVRGMRNPMNSWAKSDSEPGCEIVTGSHEYCRECDRAMIINGQSVCPNNDVGFVIGYNDHELMMKLAKAGPVHGKFRRMITVYVDITAPLYFWKEFDTYKIGTTANSCSTMHKIHAKEFTLDDFSHEHLLYDHDDEICPVEAGFYFEARPPMNDELTWNKFISPKNGLEMVIDLLNKNREAFLKTKDKKYWWQMIQLLPSSYNQKRTVQLNYEVLANIYQYRKNHKLDEWREFCSWIEGLPYAEIITGGIEDEKDSSSEV